MVRTICVFSSRSSSGVGMTGRIREVASVCQKNLLAQHLVACSPEQRYRMGRCARSKAEAMERQFILPLSLPTPQGSAPFAEAFKTERHFIGLGGAPRNNPIAVMIAQAPEQIFADLNAHITQSGLLNSQWYVGIASNPQQRLFSDHRVPRTGAWWIYRLALNHHDARGIESAYHAAGCSGGPGGGDCETCYVYAYVKTPQTSQ